MELRSILASTAVGELTFTSVPMLSPSETVSAAAAEMRQQSHGSALISEEAHLVGIITERDLLRLIACGDDLQAPLSEAMTAAPRTVTTGDSLWDAMESMDQGGYRRLPVVDTDGAPVGIIDVKTVAHFLVEHFPEAVYNQAAHAQLIAKHREGA